MHQVVATHEQRQELMAMVIKDVKPYLRERAAAVLKVVDGTPAAVVAREKLLRKRKADTLYRWIRSFEKEGVAGLRIKPGRGRKPAFFPSLCSH